MTDTDRPADTDQPTPGSPEAVARGCRCPITDNGHGAGYMGQGVYWSDADCPLHGETPECP